MKKTILLSLVLVGTLAGGRATANENLFATNVVRLTPGFINQLAEEMRTNNPALGASRTRVTAAAANAAAVRTWEDPKLVAGGMAADEEMRAENGDILYGAEQKLPLFGKPAAARRVAGAERDVESANADYQFQFLRSELASAAFRAALEYRIVAIGEQDLAWLDTTVQATESKYQTGQGRLVDVLQVQNERAKRAEQLQTDRQNLIHDQFTLNRFLNRDLQLPWPAFELPALAAPVVYSARLAEFAIKYEPKLKVMREQTKQARAMVDSTRRQRLPDVSLGALGRNYSGNGDFVQADFMLSFTVPWFNAGKYQSDVRRDEARLKATELDAADYAQTLREEVHSLTLKIDAARREAVLYRDQIIPRSEQALASAQAMLESGGGTLRDLLDTRRMLLDARLMYARAVAEQYEMLSDLVLCCGLGDLEALQMIGAEPDVQNEGNQP